MSTVSVSPCVIMLLVAAVGGAFGVLLSFCLWVLPLFVLFADVVVGGQEGGGLV